MEPTPAINDITSLGAPILLALVCNVFAAGLKASTGGAVNRWLPVIVMAFAGIAYPLIASASELNVNCVSPVAYKVLVGICIGGLSVGLHQIKKQFSKPDDSSPPA